MAKYYKVKPEFDGRVLTYFVSDGRKKKGYRTENIELVGMELLPPKKWKQITCGFPERFDMFEEVKVNPYMIYRSFGVLFKFNDDEIICGEYITIWKKARDEFNLYYAMFNGKRADSKYVNTMSIETLQFGVNYYSKKLAKKHTEELIQYYKEIHTEDSITNV